MIEASNGKACFEEDSEPNRLYSHHSAAHTRKHTAHTLTTTNLVANEREVGHLLLLVRERALDHAQPVLQVLKAADVRDVVDQNHGLRACRGTTQANKHDLGRAQAWRHAQNSVPRT